MPIFCLINTSYKKERQKIVNVKDFRYVKLGTVDLF